MRGFYFSWKNYGAGNGTRTRDHQLGKLVLYQLSYARSGCMKNRSGDNCQADCELQRQSEAL